MRWVACAALVLFLAPVAAARTPLKVTPAPFRADELSMTVSFVAPWTLPAGQRYYARWQTLTPGSLLTPGCSPTTSLNPIGRLGRAGQTVAIVLVVERSMGDAFCPGPSTLQVFAQRSGPGGFVAATASKATLRPVGTIRFRVFKPV